MRIYDSVLIQPERVLELGRTFTRDYPNHNLATEVRELICSAARQAGKPLPDICV
jgi:hypothetical protein